jgi:predicted DNA binding CopG/RHH family protein
MIKLDKDEQAMIDSVEADEWQSTPDLNVEKKRFQSYAEATFKKDRRINIRISNKDLLAIKKRALIEGIPYQTLIASLLHKYVSGRLVEKEIPFEK